MIGAALMVTQGGMLPYGCHIFDYDLGNKIFKNLSKQEAINVSGKVFDGDNKPVLDVMIETWQCNKNRNYENDEGFGRIIPNQSSGKFSFSTLKDSFDGSNAITF